MSTTMQRKTLKKIFQILAPVIKQQNIFPQVVDVGARGGMKLLPDELAQFCHLVAFEPNPKEYEKLMSLPRSKSGNFKESTYFDTALWSEKGEKEFYETIAPGACTFMGDSNEKVSRNVFLNFSKGDKRRNVNFFETHLKVKEKFPLKVDRLDSLLSDKNYVDFLKVDVEGAELEVFKGAEGLLKKKKILFICSEFVFIPYYQNHPLLCDQYQFLRDHGFRLVNLDMAHESYQWKPTELPEIVDKPLPHSGDACYILDPDLNDLSGEEMFRMSLFCFVFGINGLGLAFLAHSNFHDKSVVKAVEAAIKDVSLLDIIKISWKAIPETKHKEAIRFLYRMFTLHNIRK